MQKDGILEGDFHKIFSVNKTNFIRLTSILFYILDVGVCMLQTTAMEMKATFAVACSEAVRHQHPNSTFVTIVIIMRLII